MSKKTTKKAAKKAPAEPKPDMKQAFFDAVHPVVAAGVTEPMATQHTRTAYRRFQENLGVSDE